jgi:predicted nucleic acid-binding protein
VETSHASNRRSRVEDPRFRDHARSAGGTGLLYDYVPGQTGGSSASARGIYRCVAGSKSRSLVGVRKATRKDGTDASAREKSDGCSFRNAPVKPVSDLYTIDASVFVSAFNSYEIGHRQSHKLLERLQARRLPLIEPTLLLPELAASVARVYQDEEMARAFAHSVRSLLNLFVVPLDETLAELAVDIAAKQRLRGSDTVYLAVAQHYGTALVTLDQEQYNRGSEIVPTHTPSEVIDSSAY